MNQRTMKKSAIAELLLCALLWSTGGILMKLIPWSGFSIASVRSLLAGGVMVVFMKRRGLRFSPTRRALGGSVALSITLTLFSVANKLTTAANAIVLQFTSPIWIMLLSVLLLHARFRKADVLAVGLAALGIALTFADGLAAGNTAGDLLALLAGLALGCYYLILGSCTESERCTSVVCGDVICFLIGLPFLLAERPEWSGTVFCAVIALGVFQLGVPYVLLACSLLGALEPLLNPVWVAVFEGELPGPAAMVGAALVIVTVTIWCIYNERQEAVRA
ncbi:MAG: DMT family transporter [Oscillospiraceae bacterium]|nr:DMT family transporter [Oscillospiraceae bacterium]